jgi:branched-chain amino acid transport system ATP-binding protein
VADALLAMRDVQAGYGGGLVLQGVDLELEAGSITCIVGPNGAGKSTVLRVISGLLTASAGSVRYDGQELVGRSPADILRAGIAQVPQSRALFPTMTVRDNILLGGYIIRRERELLRERVRMVEDLIPLLKDRSNDYAGNLSGGQRRMVEIGRALMLDPRLILMDEPSLGLDPKSVATVAELIREVTSTGRTVLLVEQNVRLGMNLARYGVVMEQGKVALTGDADGLADNPEVAAMYLGKASGQ